MQRHDWSSANQKGPMSHLSLSPCTGSRLQLTSSSRHWCLHIEQPLAQHPYFHSLMTIYISKICEWTWCHHREDQNHFPERFHSPFLAVGMNFPPQSGILNHWQFSSNTWKRISSIMTWLYLKKKKKKYLCSFSLTLLSFLILSLSS